MREGRTPTAPEGLSNTVASGLGDNLVDAWRAVAPALAQKRGTTVLVVGGVLAWGGSIGLYAVATSVALGAQRVLFVSQDAEQCCLAGLYGAQSVLVQGTDYPDIGRFDVTVDSSGLREGLAFAVGSTGPDGTCTCTAGAVHRGGDAALPVYDMY